MLTMPILFAQAISQNIIDIWNVLLAWAFPKNVRINILEQNNLYILIFWPPISEYFLYDHQKVQEDVTEDEYKIDSSHKLKPDIWVICVLCWLKDVDNIFSEIK